MKSSLLVLLLLAVNVVSAQDEVMIFDYNKMYFEDLRDQAIVAKANKIKSIKTWVYENEKIKDGKLFSSAEYNEAGLIISRVEHRFHKQRDYATWNYIYDSSGRIITIITDASFNSSPDSIQLFYTSENKINFSIEPFGSKKDTTFYFYNNDGTVKYQVRKQIPELYENRDTTFFHYDEFGDVRGSHSKTISPERRIRDKNNCLIESTSYYSPNQIKTMVRDSLCNLLSYKSEFIKGDKKILVRTGESKFSGKNILETKHFSCPHSDKNKCNGKLEFESHKKYEYNDAGLITQEIHYDKNGKIIELRKTVYETY